MMCSPDEETSLYHLKVTTQRNVYKYLHVAHLMSNGSTVESKQLIDQVKLLGLNSYEAKIWTSLLSRGVATSGELSDMAGVPRSRSYDVLESLESKGFVVMKLGKPIKYIAVPPVEVIERLKQRIKQETEVRARMLEEFRSTELFESLAELHESGIVSVDPTDITGIIKGRKPVFQKIAELISTASERVVIMLSAAEIAKNRRVISNAIEKNTSEPRIIILTDDTSRELFEGVTMRSLKTNARAVICDGTDIIFMLTDVDDIHPSYDTAIWVKSPFFASTLTSLINE
jgi:sugar-specific transcriptional regulator TrmB